MPIFAHTLFVDACTSACLSSDAGVRALRWNIAKIWPNVRWRQQK